MKQVTLRSGLHLVLSLAVGVTFIGAFSLGTLSAYFLGHEFGNDVMFPDAEGAHVVRSASLFLGAMLAFLALALLAGVTQSANHRRIVPRWAACLAGAASCAWLALLSLLLLAFASEGPRDIPFGPQLLGFYLKGALVVAANVAALVVLSIASVRASRPGAGRRTCLAAAGGSAVGLTLVVGFSVWCAL